MFDKQFYSSLNEITRSCGHIFDVKNWNTDDTGLTDDALASSARIFSALQKNLDCFGDPTSCEAG